MNRVSPGPVGAPYVALSVVLCGAIALPAAFGAPAAAAGAPVTVTLVRWPYT